MSNSPDTIVLIHGLSTTPPSWEGWIDRYTERGYWVIAPTWPEMDPPIDDLRDDPNQLKTLGLEQLVGHYASIVAELDEPPIIMGHSLGGTFTAMLLRRGLGAAGVSIDGPALDIDWNDEDHPPLLVIASRPRFVVGQDVWLEVADFALSWAVQHIRTRTHS